MKPRDAAKENLRTLGLVAGYAVLVVAMFCVIAAAGYAFMRYVFAPLFWWMDDHVGDQSMAATMAVLLGTGWLLSTLARPWIEVFKKEDDDA